MKIVIRDLRPIDGGDSVSADIEITSFSPETGETLSERRTFVLLTGQYRELGISRGSIGEDVYENIEHASAVAAAVKRGAGFLAYGAKSRRRLEDRLFRAGIGRAVAAEAAQMLTDEGYIDEERDARREAELAVGRGYGRRRVVSQLISHGYRDDALTAAGEYLYTVDFTARCRDLIAKKYGKLPHDRREREKAAAALMRLGYSLSEIKAAALDDDGCRYD